MSDKVVRCGLEVHAQLNFLNTKLFCSCSIDLSAEPNRNTCPVCRGLPGSLPSVNGKAVEFGLKLAKALSMKPVSVLKFSRKHYDYPDLPKGFQITQNLDGILGTDGVLPCKDFNIPIHQIQIEEDPAKLSYHDDEIIVDYNRCGTTLIELVTDPIFTNQGQIKSFLSQYRRLLYMLQISDTRKESSFRADVNVSVGDHPPVEVKNVGSDTDIIEAFLYEASRQSSITDFSNLGMETRNWDSDSKKTEISRDKESSSDYKYIPEGNIPPIDIPSDYYDSINIKLVPWKVEEQLLEKYDLSEEQAQFLLDNSDLLPFFESCMNMSLISHSLRSRFFWQEFLTWYNIKDSELSFEQTKRLFEINLKDIISLLKKLDQGKLSNQEFKKLLRKYVLLGNSLTDIVEANTSHEYTISVIDHLKNTYPQHFSQVPLPPNKINYLVGLGVKYSKGKVNPKSLQELLKKID